MALTTGEFCDDCSGVGALSGGHQNDPNSGSYTCETCGGAGYRQIRCDFCSRTIGMDAAKTCVCCRLELCSRCECVCNEPGGCDCKSMMVTERVAELSAMEAA